MKIKKCTICKKELPLTEFATRKDRKNLLYQSNCKACQKEYRKKHYEKNKEKYIQKAVKYKQDFRKWFSEYKSTLSCESCGDSRYWVLDFHHKNPNEKDSEVSQLVTKCSKKLLQEEINKCKVLCANCHRDLHYKEALASEVLR